MKKLTGFFGTINLEERADVFVMFTTMLHCQGHKFTLAQFADVDEDEETMH